MSCGHMDSLCALNILKNLTLNLILLSSEAISFVHACSWLWVYAEAMSFVHACPWLWVYALPVLLCSPPQHTGFRELA